MPGEIVILTRSLPLHQLGGMETIVWDLAREFVREGQAVRVITTALPGETRGEFDLDGVRIVPLSGCPSARYTRAWWKGSRAYFEAHCLQSTAAVLSVSAAGFGLLPIKRRLPHVPFVMQAHGTSWAEVRSKWRSRRLKSMVSSARNLLWLPRDLASYGRFDAVVAVGERVRASLRSAPIKWFTRAESIHLIENGVDSSLFRPDPESRREVRARLGVDERTPVVISANRLHVQKGTHLCIAAIADLARSGCGVRYVIAGDGPERDSLKEAIHAAGLDGSVTLLGRIGRSELAWWMRGADAMLFLTQRDEGLPLNILEALATGLPVVASKHLQTFASAAIHEVDPRDPKIVCGALIRALGQSGERTPFSLLPAVFELRLAVRRYLTLFGLHADEPAAGGTIAPA
ncbi:MAG TPA: glycosyltransferase family 4 protein [Steroidobacteraceae bacterium]|nr:glycosyltransferase family 4 protein [Steroidobacteraceae bacterium]